MRANRVTMATVGFLVALMLLFLLLEEDGIGGNYKRSARLENNVYMSDRFMHSPHMVQSEEHQPRSVELSCYRLNNSWIMQDLHPVNLACRKHFPRAFIIGAQGCGSWVLRNLLAVHPGVATPLQDTEFFSTNYYKDLAWYFNRMPHAIESQLTLEKSSEYLTYPGTAARISKDLHEVKLIVLLCDPVKRALNEYFRTNGNGYAHNRTENSILSPKQARDKLKAQQAWDDYAMNNPSQFLRKGTFDETVVDEHGEIVQDSLYIDKGIYAKHLKQWLRNFPTRNMLFLDEDGDDILKHPVPVLNKVETFLGLSRFFQENNFLFNKQTGRNCLAKPIRSCMESRGRSKPQMAKQIQDKLSAFYMPHNLELKQLLNTSMMFNY